MEYKDIRPAEVLLDPDNPRLPDGTSNDKEAINRLIAEGFNQLVALARDIVDTGETNPAELPIVMKDGDKYFVLEGNRRFAVLKLLDDPRLADDPAHRAAIERIRSRSGNPPASIHCVVVAGREDAEHWITLRHTGANNGVGVREWSPEQSARHRHRLRRPIEAGTARSITIADELTEAFHVDERLATLIAKVRAEKLTNIGRLFSTDVLTRMQFRIEGDTTRGTDVLTARHTADQLHGFVAWAFGYLDTNPVDAYKNPEVREKLLNAHAYLIPNAGDALSEYQRIADVPFAPTADPSEGVNTGGGPSGQGPAGGDGVPWRDPTGGSDTDGGSATGTDGRGGGGGKRGMRPEACLYSRVKLPGLSDNVRRLLNEAKGLRFDVNPAVTCVLARVVLELAVSEPRVLAWSGAAERDTLDHKVRQCVLELDPQIANPRKRTRHDLSQAWQEASGEGISYLHQFIHNPQVRQDHHLARRFSHAFTPLLNAINDAIP